MSESNNAFANIRDRAKKKAASHLLLAGAMFAEQARQDLSGASGFPKPRTGTLKDAVVMSAYDAGQVAKDDYVVRVGIHKRAFYGYILFLHGWKGFKETMDRVRSAVMKVIERGA